jgi:hypothetical protein
VSSCNLLSSTLSHLSQHKHTPLPPSYCILGYNLLTSVLIFENNAEEHIEVKIMQVVRTGREILLLWRKLQSKSHQFEQVQVA